MSDSRDNGISTGEVGYRRPPAEHQFKPGNPGRVKGSRNKLGEAFVEALQNDFAEHGVSVIERVRADEPTQYLKVIASVIPKEVHHTVEDYDALSDEQLATEFSALAARLAQGDPDGGRGRAKRLPAPLPH